MLPKLSALFAGFKRDKRDKSFPHWGLLLFGGFAYKMRRYVSQKSLKSGGYHLSCLLISLLLKAAAIDFLC